MMATDGKVLAWPSGLVDSGSTLTAVGPFQLPALPSGTLQDLIWDPAIATDCFRRVLKMYLFARQAC